MRLLNVDTLELHEFNALHKYKVVPKDCGDDGIPPYATLSHTWGAKETEVTFTDFAQSTGK